MEVRSISLTERLLWASETLQTSQDTTLSRRVLVLKEFMVEVGRQAEQ